MPTSTASEDTTAAAHPTYRGPYIEMLVSSIIGLIAALVLSADAVALAANPDAALSCNINAKISCGTVGTSWQANVLGFPNAFLGLMAEPVVITIAVAGLAGVRFPRWFLLAAQAVYFIGFAFAYWLFVQAYFVIGAMCPWCLTITVTTTLVFFSLARINILEGNFGQGVKDALAYPLRMGVDVAIQVILLAIIAAMVLARYVL